MNTLNLRNINLHSPYLVGQTEENDSAFYFTTDFGLKYTISFMLEYSFVQRKMAHHRTTAPFTVLARQRVGASFAFFEFRHIQ